MMKNEKNKILVVDDEAEVVDILKSFLTRHGYEVDSALSGEEALGILEKKETNLILLDLKMPGLSGEEIAKIVRQKYPAIKIIVVTAYPQQSHNLCRDDILEEVLIKPITLNELYEKLLEVEKKLESALLDLKDKERLPARLFSIKAKILVVEPAQEQYKLLDAYFKRLSHKGENYQIERAADLEEYKTKVALFKPDILAVNASMDIPREVSIGGFIPKEVIVYSGEGQMEKLAQSVAAACLKHGLIEIKWTGI